MNRIRPFGGIARTISVYLIAARTAGQSTRMARFTGSNVDEGENRVSDRNAKREAWAEPLRIPRKIGYRWAPDASRASCSMRLTRW